MFSRIRYSFFICSGFVLGLVLLGLRSNSIGSIEHLYSHQEYVQDLSKIYHDLGALSIKRNDHSKAIKSYTEAIKTKPDYLEAYDALGLIYEKSGNHNEALKIYLQAMNEDANFIECRVCKDLNAIKTAPNTDYEKLTKKISTQSEWEGQDLHDKTIYLYAEKGLGDSIQFARFLPALAANADKVYFKPQKPLTELFKQTYTDPKIVILDASANPDDLTFDYYSSLLGVARYLDVTPKTLPGTTKYFTVAQDTIEKFKNTVFQQDEKFLKVGLVWQGDPGHVNDKNRSIPLAYFSKLFNIPHVKVYSLQKGFGREQIAQLQNPTIYDLDRYISDFTDTVAAIENLDLVITADTAVAHLSGALGKPTWILLPHVTDWRWFMYAEGDASCWYSSVTKFRQETPGDWNTVIDRVSKKVTTLAAARK